MPARSRSRLTIVVSWSKGFRRVAAPVCLGWMLAAAARADPLSAYLPLNLEPEMERQIERVLILADEPILKRPFPVELVKAALPEACRKDARLCTRVRRYLERYSRNYAVTHASATVAASHGAHDVIPNEHGLSTNDDWQLSAQGYVQPSDYLLASAGGIAYAGRTQATGTMVSVGASWAQLDAGYRDHWLSPMTDTGSMLLSTEAPTTPSVTLSNWEPLTRLGLQYEFSLGRLMQTGSDAGNSLAGNNILYQGLASRGDPKLFSMQLSIEPFPGWSLGLNRNLEYGGGSGLPGSARFLLRDFFKPSGLSQTQGNQQASYVSRFIFPGKTPFAVYFQYAGEDNSDGGSYLLGNAALSAGIDFPRLCAPLRCDLRGRRVAEHLVRAQHLPRWHDQLRPGAGDLGSRSAQLRRRRRGAQPDAAARLGAAVRRLSGAARPHTGESELLRWRHPAVFAGRAAAVPVLSLLRPDACLLAAVERSHPRRTGAGGT